MDEIVQEFLVESLENLDQLDRDLVALERDPGSRDLLSSIFRTIHTIKGTSGFLAFNRLESVTHVGENLLSKLRDGEREMTPTTTDVLLKMVDAVRSLLDSIETTGSEGEQDVQPVVDVITQCLNNPNADSGAASAQDGSAAQAPAQEAEAKKSKSAKKTAAKASEKTAKPAAGKAKSKKAAPDHQPAEQNAEQAEHSQPQAEVASIIPAQTTASQAPDRQPATQPATQQPAKPGGEASSGEGQRRAVADSTIRVDVDLLDTLMRLVGELVLTRNQVVSHAAQLQDTTLIRSTQRLNLIASELQEGVMKTRMQPIDHLWAKLPRVVRDLAHSVGKQIELVMVGRDTELDRTLLEAIKDPLTHIVRNSCDHGIEPGDKRVQAGKARTGTLTLRAFHQSGQVVIEVSDDGGGINPDKVAAKALERRLITQDQLERMSERDIVDLVFKPGFSTAEAVSNISGRGVGMDVVRTNIEAIGGSVELDSTFGKGTTTRLTIPLTLAIVPALTVQCRGERYAIPQVSMQELVFLDELGDQPDAAAPGESSKPRVEYVGGAPVFRLRGKLLPLVYLDEVLGLPQVEHTGPSYLAVLQADDRKFGLVVDRVLNTEEIVVKSLGAQLKNIGLYAGATILGDGRVALILDVQALSRRSHTETLERMIAQETSAEAELAAGRDNERLLVVAAGGHRVAIPLGMVTRLEEFAAASIERSGGREVAQYRGQIIPVMRLADLLGSYSQVESESWPVVVYSERGKTAAVVVDEILDIVEDAVRSRTHEQLGAVTGSAVIQDRVTELLDVRAAILAADPRFGDFGPDGQVDGIDQVFETDMVNG